MTVTLTSHWPGSPGGSRAAEQVLRGLARPRGGQGAEAVQEDQCPGELLLLPRAWAASSEAADPAGAAQTGAEESQPLQAAGERRERGQAGAEDTQAWPGVA